LASKTVCAACIGDRYLRNQVRAKKFVAECAYCGKRSHATTIGDLSEWIEVAFENHYYLTSPDAEGAELIAIKGGDADFERHGDSAVDAIAEAADISEEVAEDVRQVLEDRCYDHGKAEVGEESGFEDDSYYARLDVDDEEFREGWTQFESMLQKQSRFFLHGAELLRKEIFNGLADHKTRVDDALSWRLGQGVSWHPLSGVALFARIRIWKKHSNARTWRSALRLTHLPPRDA
jgi:hypothetical protein